MKRRDFLQRTGLVAGTLLLPSWSRGAAELVPDVAPLPIVEIRSCRRPMSDGGLPLHGPLPGLDGVILATGHGSQGITWGIGSGEAVAAGVLTGAWDPALAPARFVASGQRR